MRALAQELVGLQPTRVSDVCRSGGKISHPSATSRDRTAGSPSASRPTLLKCVTAARGSLVPRSMQNSR
jgi:hypothetical protein